MTPQEQEVYTNFTTNIKRFAANAATAAQEIRQGSTDPSEQVLMEIAHSACDLEGGCGQISEMDNDEMGCFRSVVQNVLHSPMGHRSTTLYHAATSLLEQHDSQELTEFVRTGARNPNQMERLVNNLYRICAQINRYLQEGKS